MREKETRRHVTRQTSTFPRLDYYVYSIYIYSYRHWGGGAWAGGEELEVPEEVAGPADDGLPGRTFPRKPKGSKGKGKGVQPWGGGTALGGIRLLILFIPLWQAGLSSQPQGGAPLSGGGQMKLDGWTTSYLNPTLPPPQSPRIKPMATRAGEGGADLGAEKEPLGPNHPRGWTPFGVGIKRLKSQTFPLHPDPPGSPPPTVGAWLGCSPPNSQHCKIKILRVV